MIRQPTREEWRDWCRAMEKPEPKATSDNPHTFEQGVKFLRSGNFIDYEVKVGQHQGALLTRESWLESVVNHSFIDYDGMGNEIDGQGNILGAEPGVPGIKLGKSGWIKPSEAGRIRPETKYILWYNR